VLATLERHGIVTCGSLLHNTAEDLIELGLLPDEADAALLTVARSLAPLASSVCGGGAALPLSSLSQPSLISLSSLSLSQA
jgi:hypothetical protein